jgi:hypothetical protein
MDVQAFVSELLLALADTELFEHVDLSTEGPIVKGYAYVRGDLFVRCFFNQPTQTIAFALIEEGQRIWGIDRDNQRGWHLHPIDNPKDHIVIDPLSVSEIVARLRDVLDD